MYIYFLKISIFNIPCFSSILDNLYRLFKYQQSIKLYYGIPCYPARKYFWVINSIPFTFPYLHLVSSVPFTEWMSSVSYVILFFSIMPLNLHHTFITIGHLPLRIVGAVLEPSSHDFLGNKLIHFIFKFYQTFYLSKFQCHQIFSFLLIAIPAVVHRDAGSLCEVHTLKWYSLQTT